MKSYTQIRSEIKRDVSLVADTLIIRELSSLCVSLEYEDICNVLEIVDCVLHRVFYVQTESTELIIKQLSPKMLDLPKELLYHINSQKIAQIAHASGVPTIIAKENRKGISVHQIGQNYYMIYDYYPHAIKKQVELIREDCFMIGNILAQIHSVDFSSIIENSISCIRILKYKRVKSFLRRYLFKKSFNLFRVYRWILFLFIQEHVRLANRGITKDIISHCDLTHNNILWLNNAHPCVIDWDAAGYTNTEKDIMQTVYEWCFYKSKFKSDFFNAFLDGYLKEGCSMQELPKQACLAALSEDIEYLDNNLEPEEIDQFIDSIIAKWRNIRKIRNIVNHNVRRRYTRHL